MILILDKLCYVAHLTQDVGNANQEMYVIDPGLTQVAINVQPAAPQDAILDNGAFIKAWIGYITESGVRTGDLITISGTTYSGVQGSAGGLANRQLVVRGKENWNMLDMPHYELTLTEFIENEAN